ncbi:MAG: Stp1/IreP family PP2C-type Ser/Thr phosphatase [Syntrophomonadaceae bacterium]|nr:Stp1/IreP family PP2C-type Ser/Thr phosphatase [Syntrophomonadaceae bacterium]
MKVVSLSDIGSIRNRNEDRFLVREEEGLFVICDGMGGHKGGDIASSLAIETIEKEINENPQINLDVLNQAIRKANLRIWQEGHNNPDWHEMGTTITIAKITDMRIDICHVGDSRLYLIRDKEIKQITKDHTLAAELVERGISEKEPNSYSHILTRALGVDKEIDIDNISFDLYKEDIILLCSDGLSDMLSDQELYSIITKNNDIAEIGNNLLQEALTKGGYDNITLILVQLSGR